MLNALARCNSICIADALLVGLVSLKVDRRRVEVKHIWRAARLSGAAWSVAMGEHGGCDYQMRGREASTRTRWSRYQLRTQCDSQ